MTPLIHRPITRAEILQLEGQGCYCKTWDNVQVAEGFDARRVRNVRFSGNVLLGIFINYVSFPDGRTRPTGITHADIHNCRIHDNVYINRIHTTISNYDILENVVIENVDSIAVAGDAMFGNGTRVLVMNESGGRDVPLYNKLSPQVAYIMALQRHRPELIEALEQMIETEIAAVKSTRGCIGAGARIENCGVLRDVNIGDAAEFDGVKLLDNGSIVCNSKNPVRVGSNVIASDFIFAHGAYIHSAAFIHKSYIGAGCNIGIQFTAKNCLFFGGAQLSQGEAASLFAGPLATSSHKSTLLIAGLVSFFNAGSGTNQSNHKYKLGPVHQGVFERGCKTGSDAYLLWPSKIAPFTTILGRHPRHLDTSNYPFSLLVDDGGKSILLPAWNLQNIGIWRDDIKWRDRILLEDDTIRGRTIYDVLTPFTVRRMQDGLRSLKAKKKGLNQKSNLESQGFVLKHSAIAQGIVLYEAATALYVQRVILERFTKSLPATLAQFHSLIISGSGEASEWVDAAGSLIPKSTFDDLLDRIERTDVKTLQEVEAGLDSAFKNYAKNEWLFVQKLMEEKRGKKAVDFMPRDIVEVLVDSLQKSSQLLISILTDAGKEFSDSSHISFGLDCNAFDRSKDFSSVRGVADMNDFVQILKSNFNTARDKVNNLVRQLERIGR